MSKKISIAKNLDESKLKEEIVKYMNGNEEEPYLFMNKETIDDLEYAAPLGSYENKMKCGVTAMYRGFKLYENNDLNYGEVELR